MFKTKKEEVKNLIINSLCSGDIIEDAIFVKINRNMVNMNGELFGIQCNISKLPVINGQACIRKYGSGAFHRDDKYNGLEFSVDITFDGETFKTIKSIDINNEQALKICEYMLNTEKIYDAYCNRLW